MSVDLETPLREGWAIICALAANAFEEDLDCGIYAVSINDPKRGCEIRDFLLETSDHDHLEAHALHLALCAANEIRSESLIACDENALAICNGSVDTQKQAALDSRLWGDILRKLETLRTRVVLAPRTQFLEELDRRQ